MDSHELLDRLARKLTRAGVPRPRAQRLLAELEDHYHSSAADAVARGATPEQAEIAAIESLGTPEKIAAATLSAMARERWIGRHRVTCLILGFLLYPLFVTLITLLLIGAGSLIFNHTGVSRTGSIAVVMKWTGELLCDIAVPLACLVAIRRLTRRYFFGRAFVALINGIVMIWSLFLALHITLPHGVDNRTFVSLDLWIGRGYYAEPSRITLVLLYLAFLPRTLLSQRTSSFPALKTA